MSGSEETKTRFIANFKSFYGIDQKLKDLEYVKERRAQINDRLSFLRDERDTKFIPKIQFVEAMIQDQVSNELPKGKGNDADRKKLFEDLRKKDLELPTYDNEVALINREIRDLEIEKDKLEYNSKVDRRVLEYCTAELKFLSGE